VRDLIIDGMLSGTGARDAVAGGYLDPRDAGLSSDLVVRIEKWLLQYEAAHYHQFADKAESERLDQQGVAIARQVGKELPGSKIEYFSHAEMRRIDIT
jgi:hypothetical protein